MGVCAGLDPGLALPPGPSSGVSTVIHILNHQLCFSEGDDLEEIFTTSLAILLNAPCVKRCILDLPSLRTPKVIRVRHDAVLLDHYSLTVWPFPRTH